MTKQISTAIMVTALLSFSLATCASAPLANTVGEGGDAQTAAPNAPAVSSDPTSTAPARDNVTTAAQLAHALNVMNGESARVSGNTVTLIKVTNVQRDLTVPAGVTLDIAGDGGLRLGDGRTLTVLGTVNAPQHGIGFDDEGGRRTPAITINGSGTINLKGKGSVLIAWSGDGIARKLTLDGVTLVGIADNDHSLVGVGEGGELVLLSGAITGNGGGVFVRRSAFIMEGGVISGNSGDDGVRIQNNSSLILRADRIQGSTASDGFAANTSPSVVIWNNSTAKWGTGGTYTKGGVTQIGGGNIGDTLNVRSGPSADYGVVGQVSRNTRVEVLESSGAWWKIRAGAVEGWVNSGYLRGE